MNALAILAGLDSFGFTVMRLLLSVLWQSAILFALIWLLTFLLRKKSETVRHALWTSAILLLPVIPLLTLGAAKLGTPHAELQVIPLYTTQLEIPDLPPLQPQDVNQPSEKNIIPPVEKAAPFSLKSMLSELTHYPWALGSMAYLLFVFGFLVWIGIIRLRIRRWIYQSGAVMDARVIGIFHEAGEKMKIGRECLVMENDRVPAPMTCRTFRPVVILPRGFAEGLSDAELYAVARHELTHVKNYDTLIFTLLAIVRAVYFFQPLAWYAAHQVSYLAEVRCDRAAVESAGESLSYIELLTRMADKMPKRALSTELAAGIIFSKSVFFRRIEALLSGSKIQKLSRLAIAGLLLTGALSLVLASALPLGEKRATIEELIKKSKEYESLLHSGKVSVIKEQISLKDSTVQFREEIICYFEGDTFFTEDKIVDQKEKTFFEKTILCTPEKCEELTKGFDEKGQPTYSQGDIYGSQHYLMEDYNALSYGMRIQRDKISDFLQGKRGGPNNPPKSVSIIGREKISGFDCYVIHMDFTNGDRILTVWLSPGHQLKPLKMEESYPQDSAKAVITFNYTLIKGIWCTKNQTTILYNNNNQAFVEHNVEFTEFKSNIPVPSEIFSWKLPKGIKAYDHRTAEWVIVSAEDDTNKMEKISVRVLSEGKPVPNADIYRLLMKYGRLETDTETVSERIATTGPDGTFSLPVKMKNGRIDGGDYFSAIVPNRLAGFTFIGINTDPDSATITLYPVSTVSGKVQDSKGRPITGAEVKAWGMSLHGMVNHCDGSIPGMLSITDGQGRFKLEQIPDKATVGFHITAKGHASQNRSEIPAGTNNISVTMEPESRITGRVMYETGEPAKGVVVTCRALKYNAQTVGYSNCITDERGVYVFPNLSGGMYSIFIQPDSTIAGWVAAPKENIGADRGKTRGNVDFRIIRGIPVSGRVVEKETGNPVPGVRVLANIEINRSNYTISATKAGEDGRYTIGVIPGQIYIMADPPEGFFEGWGSKSVIVSQQKQIEGVDVQIQRGVELHGTIRLPDGRPAAGVLINNCSQPGNDGYTDKQGNFIISGNIPGSSYTFYALKPKFNLESYFSVKINPDVNVDVVLHEPINISVSGTVVDYNNKPAPGLMVGVVNVQGFYLKKYPESSITDSSGKFTIHNLCPIMRYQLTVQDGMANSVDFTAGKDLGPFRITLPRNDRWLEGTVRDEDGKPLVNAEVFAFGNGTQKTVSDQKGWFRLNGIVSENIQELLVKAGIIGRGSFQNVPTNQKKDLLIPTKYRSLSGKVSDINGKTIAGALVTIDRSVQGLSPIKIQADDDGYFFFNGPAFKSETLVVSCTGSMTKNVKVNMAGEDVKIILQPSGESIKSPAGETNKMVTALETAPSAVSSNEKNPTIISYQSYLKTLDAADRKSVPAARDEFLKQFSKAPGETTAEGYRAFRKFYQDVVDKCGRKYFWPVAEPIYKGVYYRKEYQEVLNEIMSYNHVVTDDLLNKDPIEVMNEKGTGFISALKMKYKGAVDELIDFRKCGMKFSWGEGHWYLAEDAAFLAGIAARRGGKELQEYEQFLAEEGNKRLGQDGVMLATADELRQKIIRYENFAKKHPTLPETKSVVEPELTYHLIFPYIRGFEYPPERPKSSQKPKIKPEYIKSYEKFLKENKDSDYYPLIKDVYNILKKHNFTWSEEFPEYLKSRDSNPQLLQNFLYREKVQENQSNSWKGGTEQNAKGDSSVLLRKTTPSQISSTQQNPTIISYQTYLKTLDAADRKSVPAARDEFLKQFSKAPGDVAVEGFRVFRSFYKNVVFKCERKYFSPAGTDLIFKGVLYRKEYQNVLNEIMSLDSHHAVVTNDLLNKDPMEVMKERGSDFVS
ncbi:MAG: M56 family metallopeptidase, partial [Candidatus Latescibacterota bacterium]